MHPDRELSLLVVPADTCEVPPHSTILDNFRVGSHPLPTITLRRRCACWQKISLGSPRPPNSPKTDRCRGRRCPRIGQRPRTRVTRIHPPRRTTPLARRGKNQRYRGRTHKGSNGTHREEEAEKGLQKDHPAQADLYPPADWPIRVPTAATADTIITAHYGHRIERQLIAYHISSLLGCLPFLVPRINVFVSRSMQAARPVGKTNEPGKQTKNSYHQDIDSSASRSHFPSVLVLGLSIRFYRHISSVPGTST